MALDIGSDRNVFMLKIATIILGVFCVSFTGASYHKELGKEEYFLAIGIIALLISIILLVLLQLGVINAFKPEIIDGVTHLVLAVLLVIGAIVFSVSVSDYWKYEKSSKKALRAIACLLGFVDPILYVLIGVRRLGFL